MVDLTDDIFESKTFGGRHWSLPSFLCENHLEEYCPDTVLLDLLLKSELTFYYKNFKTRTKVEILIQ